MGAYTRCSCEDSARCKSKYLAVWQSLSPIDAYMFFPFVNTHFFIFAVGKICNYSDLKYPNFNMRNTVEHNVRIKISYSKYGCVFFVSSFPQFDVKYVIKLLALFEKEG